MGEYIAPILIYTLIYFLGFPHHKEDAMASYSMSYVSALSELSIFFHVVELVGKLAQIKLN